MKFYVESVVNKSDLKDGFTIEENVFFQDEKQDFDNSRVLDKYSVYL